VEALFERYDCFDTNRNVDVVAFLIEYNCKTRLFFQDLLTRRWFRVGDKLAREKVGQALRDAIKTRRTRSSSPGPVSSVASSKKHSFRSTSQEFLGGVGRQEEEGDSSSMPVSASCFTMSTSHDTIPRRPSIIPGLNFQPLEPRGLEQQFGSTIGASDNLWSLLKGDASEKLKDPTTFASFWEIASPSSAAASPTAAPQYVQHHQAFGGGPAATTNSHAKQGVATYSLLAGGNEHAQNEMFERTPMPYQFGGSTLPTNMGHMGSGSTSGSANLAYAPPLHMHGLEQQQQHHQHQGERPRPSDVYNNSEASRKKVLGMFQHLLPPMEQQQQQQLPMEPLAQHSLQQQQQQLQQQQIFGNVPLSMEGEFLGYPQTSNLQQPLEHNLLQARYSQSRRSSLDWYTQPASDDVFDMGRSS
jgi:hypothetical protein